MCIRDRGSFVSSTYWTERIGPTAALATIVKHRRERVHEHLIALGTRVQDGWAALARRHGLHVHVGGIAPLGHLKFEYPNALAVRTLFTQLMLDRGILATGAFYAMHAQTDADVDRYLAETDGAFAIIADALADGSVERRLDGPVAHGGFHRLT